MADGLPSADPRTPDGLWQSVPHNLRAGARLAFLRPVSPESFQPSADVFAVIVVLNVLLLFVLGVASVGFNGQLNVFEFPRALLFVPATLLFGLVALRMGGAKNSILTVALPLVAAGLVLSLILGVMALLMPQLPRRLVGGNWWPYLYYGAVLWWSLVIIAAVRRLADAGPGRNLAAVLAGLLLLVSPMVW